MGMRGISILMILWMLIRGFCKEGVDVVRAVWKRWIVLGTRFEDFYVNKLLFTRSRSNAVYF